MAINITNFLKHDIWLLPEQRFPLLTATAVKALKILLLAYQGFQRDHCQLRSSALTLYTLLAIVPVIAMLFGIAQGFGLEQILQQQLFAQIPHQETTVLKLINFAQNLLDSTKGEVVAGIGIIVLLWTIISMISNIEESFNYIWKLSHSRTLSRKLSDYLSLMLLAPMLLILASSITVFLNTRITWLKSVISLPEFSEGLLLNLLSYSPLLLMIGLLSLTFIFMPNHKISYRAGLIAGIFSGLLYHWVQSLYISLQIGVSSYNAVYGSFAAVPLFVVWIQTGWMIVLFGCEITFFIQNYAIHRYYHKFSSISFALKKILALQVTHLVIKNFSAQKKPLTAEKIAQQLQISIPLVHPLLSLLQTSQILIELKTEEDDEVYLPAVDINVLSVAYVINALEHSGINSLPDLQQETLFVDIENSAQDRLLKDVD